MPALGFKKEFAEAVENGEKRQTVRALRKDGRSHCKAGDTIKLYTGMRTTSCRLLGTAIVTNACAVKIMDTGMELGGRLLPSVIYARDQHELTDNEFAQADGFDSFSDMTEWFTKNHGLPFEGVVIQWGELR